MYLSIVAIFEKWVVQCLIPANNEYRDCLIPAGEVQPSSRSVIEVCLILSLVPDCSFFSMLIGLGRRAVGAMFGTLSSIDRKRLLSDDSRAVLLDAGKGRNGDR